ncbi:PREDICTED: putative F-box/kelch-repeat protein At1g20940 [Camelina sativa]|uniref:F-box/kelch-repeat protein At1g20940 n=1 Tax=Camelina sativa TaxID=90675 RepID=A0ABM1R8S9_CAMSA|nr:PREDICTED: putative F-box/kelch-repeat protein At1g20940 [Camelina sativa]
MRYCSWFKPSLFNLKPYGAYSIFCQPLVSSCDSTPFGNKMFSYGNKTCYIFGSCSGLLLFYVNGLFIVNPLTKTFRILDHHGSKLIPMILGGSYSKKDFTRAMCVGFAVNQNRTSKSFKIVCILEMGMVYGFEISDGYSWRLSDTTINAGSKSDLMTRMKHVYLDNTLHWLRNDGSIVTFNPETEQARMIPSIFHRESDTKLLLAADDKINRLTLISGTKEKISVYTLFENSKWTLARRIKIVPMEDNILVCWDMVAYDGKRLVVRDRKSTFEDLVHVYDLETNSWRVLGSTWCTRNNLRDFYKFTPSLFSIELDEQTKIIVDSNDQRIPYLIALMGLIGTQLQPTQLDLFGLVKA